MRRLAAVVLVLALAAPACTRNGDALNVQARFDDVADLVPMAPVMYADIAVGQVESIRLAGDRALVAMEIDPEAEVPANVIARVRRTSVLGERVIDLVAPEEGPAGDLLKDGATIADTEVRADLENLVIEGSDLFGAISASELADMVDTGAEAFGGRGADLAQIVVNFRDITRAYSKETGRIENLIRSIDRFNTTVASRSDAHKQALRNTARAIAVLDEESGRLERALGSLARLALASRDILDDHVDEMDRFFDQAHVIFETLRRQQRSIELLLRWAPRHNRNTQLVEYLDFNQIFQDFVICGLNDNPDDPARRCKGED
ncbi:MAG TPA: MlaD family protein [Actinomycetota bacterium]|nr:MlaD family protein [Actinomycetota bacterium]